jgi:hypothetical protein
MAEISKIPSDQKWSDPECYHDDPVPTKEAGKVHRWLSGSSDESSASVIRRFALQRIARPRRKHNRHEERLKKLEQIVQEQGEMLAALIGDSVSIELGPFEKWRESDAASEYAGKHVAFLPSSGKIIASSHSLAEVLAGLSASDPENKTVVGFVPR